MPGDNGEAVPCPFDVFADMYTNRPPEAACIRADYQRQKREFDARVASAGDVAAVPSAHECFRNHHRIPGDDEQRLQLLSDLAGGYPVADQFDFLPDGLVYRPNFLTGDEEQQLVQRLDEHGWDTDLSRRTIQFGFKFEHRIDALLRADPIPQWLDYILRRVVDEGYMDTVANQVIVNEYRPGQHFINPHSDRHCFGEKVVTISACDSWSMVWINARDRIAADAQTVPQGSSLLALLERRSIAVFGGSGRQQLNVPGSKGGAQSRWKWLHGISKATHDFDAYMNAVPRTRRVSLTLRNVDVSRFRRRMQLVESGLIDPSEEAARRRRKLGKEEGSVSDVLRVPSTEWTSDGFAGGGVEVRLSAERVASCCSTLPQFAVGHVMQSSDAPVHVAEFELSADCANAAVGVAPADQIPSGCGAGHELAREVVPGPHWGLCYWMRGTLHNLTGDTAATTEDAAVRPLGAHDHVRFVVDFSAGTVSVSVDGAVLYNSKRDPAASVGVPLVPYVFFNLNHGEFGTRVGLRQGRRVESTLDRGPASARASRGGRGRGQRGRIYQ
eukprot:TRINITY_DN1557_c1_g1_i2.p1 TRINITY_DN1557_c1_g1~~TRINITY_DN1557_c1_g1_i2.p1  ORF type:complete len:612 (+),score=171.50 TRINITY_DN1557_c1_g1_i2:171-1838(+)